MAVIPAASAGTRAHGRPGASVEGPLGPRSSPAGRQLHYLHIIGEETKVPGRRSVTPKVAKY